MLLPRLNAIESIPPNFIGFYLVTKPLGNIC